MSAPRPEAAACHQPRPGLAGAHPPQGRQPPPPPRLHLSPYLQPYSLPQLLSGEEGVSPHISPCRNLYTISTQMRFRPCPELASQGLALSHSSVLEEYSPEPLSPHTAYPQAQTLRMSQPEGPPYGAQRGYVTCLRPLTGQGSHRPGTQAQGLWTPSLRCHSPIWTPAGGRGEEGSRGFSEARARQSALRARQRQEKSPPEFQPPSEFPSGGFWNPILFERQSPNFWVALGHEQRRKPPRNTFFSPAAKSINLPQAGSPNTQPVSLRPRAMQALSKACSPLLLPLLPSAQDDLESLGEVLREISRSWPGSGRSERVSEPTSA